MSHPFPDRPDIGPMPVDAARARWAILSLMFSMAKNAWLLLWQLIVLAACIRYLWHG